MNMNALTPSSVQDRDSATRGASGLALLSCAVAIVLSVAAATAAASESDATRLPPAPRYDVHHLTLNGAGCKVAGIDAGAATGTCNTPDGSVVRAFIWTEATGVVDIGTLGGSSAGGGAIDAGRIGGSADIAGDAETHAYSWTAQEGMLDLGTLGGVFAGVSAVSGETLVGDSTTIAGDVHAFSWTPATGMIDLGTLGAGTESAAKDVHNGLIAGFSATNGFAIRRPVAWKTDGQMIDILGEEGGDGEATAVRHGLVVGYRLMPTLKNQAFAWREAQGLVDLGVVPGSDESFAFDTDGLWIVGQLSGVGGPSGTTTRAFVWNEESGMTAITPTSITAWATHVLNGRVLGIYGTPQTNGSRVFLWTKRRGLVDVTPRDFPGGYRPAGLDTDGRIALVYEDEDPANARSVILVPR